VVRIYYPGEQDKKGGKKIPFLSPWSVTNNLLERTSFPAAQALERLFEQRRSAKGRRYAADGHMGEQARKLR
jgi:hypothetical protein